MTSRDAEPTRTRILEAAGEMFANHGFQATTVREISQSAGANVAAVNYYFGDKQRLYVESVKQAHRWHMERASLPDWSNDTPAVDKLQGFISTFLLRIRSGPSDSWQTRLMMRELKQQDETCVAVVEDSIRPQFEILMEILRELLPPETSEEKLHLTAFSIVGQCLFYHLADPVVRTLLAPDEYAGYQVEKLSRHISEFVLAALVPGNVSRKQTLPPS